MNWHFVAHIIRDVFGKPTNSIVYGRDTGCTEVFPSLEHSLGVFAMHPSLSILGKESDLERSWSLPISVAFLGPGYCDLFISLHSDANFPLSSQGTIGHDLKQLMAYNGLIFLTNPGPWISDLDKLFTVRWDLIDEIKRYSMFRNEEVYVYENL